MEREAARLLSRAGQCAMPGRVMDSKAVSRAIRNTIRPRLKAAGFSVFTGRTAWRHGDTKIDVVNFQSFNAYLAESVGATTYSFALNLGCYFRAIPDPFPAGSLPRRGGRLAPQEYHCHLRRSMEKSLRQPELPRRTIWYIDPDGRWLEPALADAAAVLKEQALPWFEQFEDLGTTLELLLSEDEQDRGTWGMGANPSPVRHYYTGFISLALGRKDLAARHLQSALDSGIYDQKAALLKATLENLA